MLISLQSTMEFITTKGKPTLIFDGSPFTLNRRMDNGVCYWRCTKRTCPVRIATERNDIKQQTAPHNQGRQEDCGGPGQIQKVGPVWGGSGGMPPGNFESLHALKCVLGASEAPFCACTQYIYTCKLSSLFSGFRSKSMTYRVLVSGCAVVIHEKTSKLVWSH